MKNKIKKNIKKMSFKFLKLKNNVYDKFFSKKYKKRVALVSCDKWVNKAIDDLYLKYYLNKEKIKVDIISWQDENINYKNYDAIIVRSIWGFQKNQDKFEEWLEKLNKNNIKVFNSIEIIKNNYDKEIQFEVLNKNNIETIKTIFLKIDKNLKNKINEIRDSILKDYDLIITKPTISESGDDTYIIGTTGNNYKNTINIEDIESKYLFKNRNTKLMIQPFLKEVFDGEYCVTCINGKITNAVIKHSNVFENKNIIKDVNINELEPEINNLVNKILNIKEYSEALYMRVDLVKKNNKFLVMEVELLDPNLFLSFICNKKIQKQTFAFFAKAIKKKLQIIK